MKSELFTKLELFNGRRHPSITISWVWDNSWCGGGWRGELSVWTSPNDRDAHRHEISVGQGSPLGQITCMFDPCKAGAWECVSFAGTGIVERDLQWATAWAALALKSRRKMGDLDEIKIPEIMGAAPGARAA